MGHKHSKHKKRLSRIVRLLGRLRPFALPVTHRHNGVELFQEGQQFFKSLFDAIRSAEQTLLLEYYLIHDDHVGAELALELGAAASRGVRVKLIYDYIGCLDTPSSYFKGLARQGIKLLPFNIPSFKRGVYWFDKRDHRKMTIIDGRLAFLGGFNIGDEYAGYVAGKQNFRDLGFSIRGAAVGELEAIFHETWDCERGKCDRYRAVEEQPHAGSKQGNAAVNIISGGPHQRRSIIREAFLVNIASAAEEILIATPYFVPGPRIIRSLLRAVRRGVRVKLLLPARSDVPLFLLLGRSSYATLLRGGVEIFELDREILHAKVMLIDEERTVIGSANLDQRSFHRNYEINCLVNNVPFGGQIRTLLMAEITMAHPVELDVHERRGPMVRMMERVISLFGWFL
ncbi:MAG: phospholipase D-like domain-containing protein [Desulfuromonadaceae bacterium]|nr:phospholipase D-like domain-containing protein [Desulfuromonadaceae bacterium]MDD2849841.1 phospholipase D-like domain-containing protein [Desulfuromonadaceae bacterium]MDD4131612.1 phospholipase D-like domain-containing protein [Desulfuromonadaceae bacterium]